MNQILLRRDTASNWSTGNPTLGAGELGYETDTKKLKIGDGSTVWNSLGYKIDEVLTSAEKTAIGTAEQSANKGQASGYAGLDGDGTIPLAQLPASAKSSKVVADITARDALIAGDRFEGLRVHVLDASADSSVTSDSAGYILKSGLANTDWEKTYEEESLDIDLAGYFNTTTNDLDDINEGTTNKHFTATEKTKLTGVEESATADQTAGEIKTAYEGNADTNAFTDSEQTKLGGVETGADVTDATNVASAGAVMSGDAIDGGGA